MQIFLIVMFLGNCFAGPSQYLVEGKDGSKYLIETGGEKRTMATEETEIGEELINENMEEEGIGYDYFSDVVDGADYADLQAELPEDYIVANTPDAKVERFIELFGYLEFNDDDKEVLHDIISFKEPNVDMLDSFKVKFLSESPDKVLKVVQPYMDAMLDVIDKVLAAVKP